MTEETVETQAPVRTRDQVNNEYTLQAAQLGHKMKLIRDFEQDMPGHMKAMRDLAAELARLPLPASETPKDSV